MRKLITLAVAGLATVAGCRTAVPYEPTRTISNAIPRAMAEQALREAAADTEAHFRNDPFVSDPECTTTIEFVEGGLVFVCRSDEFGHYRIEARYGSTTWKASVRYGWTAVAVRGATAHYRVDGEWMPDRPRDSYRLFTLRRDRDELVMKTLEALTSLGVERATD